MVAMFHRIRAYKRHAWILHKVEVQIVGENIQISWEGSLTGSDDDDKNVNGPYNIDHRIDPGSRDADASQLGSAAAASPARVLDRSTHIKYLRHQSENCFLVPVVDPSNSKNALYLQFDALQLDIRDMWINEINMLYRKNSRKEQTETVEIVDHQQWQSQHAHKQRRRLGSRSEGASATRSMLKKQQSAAHSTSQQVKAEFKLKERDLVTGEPIPYIWESAVSGTIAGFYNTSSVLDEESKKGALGVQIRPLREVLADYDGEICMLRLKANWKGDSIDFNDPHVSELLQKEITRVHELYYRRSCTLCILFL